MNSIEWAAFVLYLVAFVGWILEIAFGYSIGGVHSLIWVLGATFFMGLSKIINNQEKAIKDDHNKDIPN
jgi:hypothetical protein